MESIKFKQIRVDEIYTSILTARRVTDERGWTGMQPIEPKEIRTGNVVMDAIGQLLGEDCNLVPKELARLLGTSISTLSGMIRLFTGTLMESFLLAYRLKRAQEWLAYSDLPLGEVTRRCGFTAQSAMGRVFKQAFQMTPGKYRKAHRPKNFRELYRWEE